MPTMKHRVNISISKPLWEKATSHADKVHHDDFSGLVTKLIVADLAKHTAPLGESVKKIGVTLSPTAQKFRTPRSNDQAKKTG